MPNNACDVCSHQIEFLSGWWYLNCSYSSFVYSWLVEGNYSSTSHRNFMQDPYFPCFSKHKRNTRSPLTLYKKPCIQILHNAVLAAGSPSHTSTVYASQSLKKCVLSVYECMLCVCKQSTKVRKNFSNESKFHESGSYSGIYALWLFCV